MTHLLVSPSSRVRQCKLYIAVVSTASSRSGVHSRLAPKAEGKRQRSRKILVQQDGNGRVCGGLTEERECVDCRVSKWGRTAPCAIGSLSTLRKRRVLEPAKFGGKACPSLSQSRPCMWEKEEVCMHSCDGYVLGETLRPSSGKRPDGMNTIVMYFKTDQRRSDGLSPFCQGQGQHHCRRIFSAPVIATKIADRECIDRTFY